MKRKLTSLRRALIVALGVALLAVSGASASTDATSGTAGPAATVAKAPTPKPATKARWARITAAAKREGNVTIYTSQNPLFLADFAKRFEQLYGIKVTINRQIDSVLTQQLTAEYGTGKVNADVFVVATKGIVLGAQQAQNRWAVDAVGPALFHPQFNRKLFAGPGKAHIVGAALLGVGWNTAFWPQGIRDMPDVLNPRLKGRVGVIIPSAFSIIDWYKWLEENWGSDFIRRLAAQEPKLYVSSLPMTQAVASGEIAVGTFVAASAVDLKEAGAPIDFRVLRGKKTGAWNAPWWLMVMRSAPHPNAAQLVTNFMFTREGQALVHKRTGSPLKGVRNTFYVTPRKQSLANSTPAKVAEFQRFWDSLFRK